LGLLFSTGSAHVPLPCPQLRIPCVDNSCLPTVPVTYNGAFLTLPAQALREGSNSVFVAHEHAFGEDGTGLHRFVDPEDHRTYLYTYLWPYYANRVFPSFDQPNLKAKITLTVTAPEDWTVVSTGTGQWTDDWLYKAGYNTLSTSIVCDSNRLQELRITQTAPANNPYLRTHQTEVALYSFDENGTPVTTDVGTIGQVDVPGGAV
jgi:aminopeptidase N